MYTYADEVETLKPKQARAEPNITSPSQPSAVKLAHAPNSATAPAAPAPEPAAAPSTSAAASAPLAPAAAAAAAVSEAKYRHAHYQLQNKVTVDIYVKKLKKEQVLCQFQEQHLTVTINDPEGKEDYTLNVELYGKVGGVWRLAGTRTTSRCTRAAHMQAHGRVRVHAPRPVPVPTQMKSPFVMQPSPLMCAPRSCQRAARQRCCPPRWRSPLSRPTTPPG